MIDYKLLLHKTIGDLEVTYRNEDTLLFALALGLGADPVDENQLRYVYERDLQPLPTMSLVLAYPGFWMKEPQYQIDWPKVLHAEEHFVIHQPLPAAATVRGVTTIDEIVDRGADKGVFLYSTKELYEKATGKHLASVYSTTLARGDGGFNGPTGNRPKPPEMPTRAPDVTCDLPTLPQQALIYRLCGDMNPLHADPVVARGAGFERPILHGRCTMGVAQHALIKSCCGYDGRRLKSMKLRFSAPFLPGETLRTQIWRNGHEVYFTSSSVERGVVVLSNGHAEITD